MACSLVSQICCYPPLLGKETRSGNRRRRTENEEANGDGTEGLGVHEPSGTASSGTSKTETLRSGGKLTLTLSVNVFDLSPRDREFVFGMIDKLQD
jgi:hypothetical protein